MGGPAVPWPPSAARRCQPVPILPAERVRQRPPAQLEPATPISELLAAFLDDFLKQNGYHAVDQAIADTTDAATAAEIDIRKAPHALTATSSPDSESKGPSD
jgi:hypothetical protein